MPLTLVQIQSQLSTVLEKHADRSTPVTRIGIFSPDPWTGTSTLTVKQQPWKIVYAPSPLAMREALLASPISERLVLLSGVPEKSLGLDILARLSGRRLYRTNQVALLKEVFQAQSLDPRVLPLVRWGDLLMEHAGDSGWAPVSGGHLTADHFWTQLLKRVWKLDATSVELSDLLAWADERETKQRIAAVPSEFVQAAAEWLESRCGPAVRPVLAALQTNSGVSPIILGLCCEVLFAEKLATNPDALQARARLERFVGDTRILPAVAASWARAAVIAAEELITAKGEAERLRISTTLDEVLRSIQASEFASLSDLSEMGFRQRLQTFAQSILPLIDGDRPIDSGTLIKLRSTLGNARAGSALERRLEKVDMLLRCVLAIGANRTRLVPSSLSDAMKSYRDEDGFVDWARSVLTGGVDSLELSDLIGKLQIKMRRIQEERNRVFGKLLADQAQSGTLESSVVPIHDVLERLVAPVAERTPILLIVLDGMSVPVFAEMQEDVAALGWTRIQPTPVGPMPVVLSSIPSVTQFARTSLLSGVRRSGGQTQESAGFASNPALLSVSRGPGPALFHKAALASGDESTVSGELRDSIQSSTKVVGLVINAIDDHLSKGDQVSIRWGTSSIRILPALLGLARDAGRAVIFVSDHGHVSDYGTTQVQGGDSDRYRNTNTPAADGEVFLAGAGVHPDIEGQRLIAPWSEAVRYSVRKNGYHGGVSLQEMVVPFGAFWYGPRVPEGLEGVLSATPAWWSFDDPVPEPVRQEVPVSTYRLPRETPPTMLFDQPTDAVVSGGGDLSWIDAALATEVFATQRKLAGRTPPTAEEVRRFVACFVGRGGKLTRTAMSRALGLSDLRLPGYLSLMRRMLNVDGYAVLSVHEESSTVEFNIALFKTQFGVY